MQVNQLQCPQCGGQLDPTTLRGRVVVCAYCGARSFLSGLPAGHPADRVLVHLHRHQEHAHESVEQPPSQGRVRRGLQPPRRRDPALERSPARHQLPGPVPHRPGRVHPDQLRVADTRVRFLHAGLPGPDARGWGGRRDGGVGTVRGVGGGWRSCWSVVMVPSGWGSIVPRQGLVGVVSPSTPTPMDAVSRLSNSASRQLAYPNAEPISCFDGRDRRSSYRNPSDSTTRPSASGSNPSRTSASASTTLVVER